MREIFKILKENFILLLGAGLFTYGLFSFKSGYHLVVSNKPEILKRISPITTTYYCYDYNQTSLYLLIIGVIFIVIGLLKIRKKRE